MPENQTLSIDKLRALVIDAFIKANTSNENAKIVADALIAAEIDGQKGHGLSRIASYAAQAKSGKVDGHAHPEILEERPGYIKIDAKNGFAFPAIKFANLKLEEIAKKQGIAAAGIVRSHHCGQLGAHVEHLAEKGLVSIMVTNSPKAMAPWGGIKPVFGTNPIAFATPRRSQSPLVIDLSLSKVARGKIMTAEKAGETIPEGWALDSEGKPTTDPKAALSGSMIPLGDAKGSALALIVEILSATLIGANHSFEATSFFDAEGDPPGVGQFILAIDPNIVGAPGYLDRLEHLVTAILSQEGTRLPGANRAAKRAIANGGLTVPPHIYQELITLAGHQ